MHVPGTKQMSTVVSDAVVVATSFFCAFQLQHTVPFGALGLATIGLAATAGTIRFYGVRKAVAYHDILVDVSTTFGMAMLAMGFMVPPNGFPDFRMGVLAAGLASAAAIFVCREKPKFKEGLFLAFSLSAIGSAIFKCFLNQLWYGVAGAAIIAGVGLFGTKGKTSGILNVDIFHYGLAAGIFLLTKAMQEVW